MNSRGCKPTEPRGKPVRPRRGRTTLHRLSVGLHPRLFVFGRFAARKRVRVKMRLIAKKLLPFVLFEFSYG
jgi:hypothetical protein